jgi:maleylpyruvate isomerase
MIDIETQLGRNAASTARLVDSLDGLDATAVAASSQLPGWNRAQLLTHLARNADGFAGLYAAARLGVVGQQYPHGPAGRAADIDAGRDLPAAVVMADLRRSIAGLDAEAGRLSAEQWGHEGEVSAGRIPLWQTLLGRRRELEVHHVDLGIGYGPGDWPSDFVADELAVAAAGLGSRLVDTASVRLVATEGMAWEVARPDAPTAPPVLVTGPAGQLLAWLLGRATTLPSPPAIRPWG